MKNFLVIVLFKLNYI